LAGQLGPKDWLVNFCWATLRAKLEADEVADCYGHPRQAFPEFLFQTLLLHDSVRGARSALVAIALTVARSLAAYRATSAVAALLLALLEESIPPEGAHFVLATLAATQRTPVGIDYGPGAYGSIKWLCTLRARFVARVVLGPWLGDGGVADEAVRALHDDVDARAVGMSLAEIKAQQGRSMRVVAEGGNGSGGGGDLSPTGVDTEPLHAQQLKKLTKIDLGVFLQLAAKHHAHHWTAAMRKLKLHYRMAAEKGIAAAASAVAAASGNATGSTAGSGSSSRTLGFTSFRDFLLLLQPSIDSRHASALYAEALRHALTKRGSSRALRGSNGGDGVGFDDFVAAGGAQLLAQDYLRQAFQHSDWSVLHGEQEIVSTLRLLWDRLQPALRPFLALASTDGSALSRLLGERLRRLSDTLNAQLLSLHGNLAASQVRAAVQTFRDTVYEAYGYCRFREANGALMRVRGSPVATASGVAPACSPHWLGLAVPPASELAAAPGPSATHLRDELHALLFMLQRELEAFVPHEQMPPHDQSRDHAATARSQQQSQRQPDTMRR